MPTIDEIARKAVLTYLEASRLPLTAAERVLGKTEGTWPVTIVADRLQARVKEYAGTVLRDDTLVADAKLQHSALDERIRAAEAEAEAERIRANADANLVKEQKAAQEAKRTVAKRDDQREQVIEQQADAKKAAVREASAKQQKVVAQRAKSVKRETLAEESKALNDQRAAAEAKAEVLDLEDKLNEVKAARKSG
jgi:hypothetical protein